MVEVNGKEFSLSKDVDGITKLFDKKKGKTYKELYEEKLKQKLSIKEETEYKVKLKELEQEEWKSKVAPAVYVKDMITRKFKDWFK